MTQPDDFNPYQAPASSAFSGNEPGYFGPQSDAEVSPRAVDLLRQTQPWVRFLSVLIFIGFGLMMLGVVIGLLIAARSARMELVGVFAVYAVLGALYLAPAVFLGRYASHIANLRLSFRAHDLENALQAQKSFWKFVGILTVVMLVLYAVGILVFVVGGAVWFASGPAGARF
jgi:hypothetical protein